MNTVPWSAGWCRRECDRRQQEHVRPFVSSTRSECFLELLGSESGTSHSVGGRSRQARPGVTPCEEERSSPSTTIVGDPAKDVVATVDSMVTHWWKPVQGALPRRPCEAGKGSFPVWAICDVAQLNSDYGSLSRHGRRSAEKTALSWSANRCHLRCVALAHAWEPGGTLSSPNHETRM